VIPSIASPRPSRRGVGLRVALRALAVALLALGLVGSGSVADRSQAAAQTAPVLFELAARADGLGLELVASGFPVVPEGKVLFLSPGTAQARLNQFSGSAFASAPYAGDLIVSLPTTLNGLGSGSLPPAPPYPFHVAADSATREDREEIGPYLIDARTDEDRSSAEARIGLATFSPEIVSVRASATVTHNTDSGALEATSFTRTAPFRVNDLLSIGEIRSRSTFRLDPSTGEPPTKETSLAVGTITVAGIELGLTEKGLSIAGDPLVPVDVAGLARLLAQSGVEVELLPAHETETTVSSAAVQLTIRRELPAPFLDTTVRMILGRSSASSSTGALSAVEPPAPSLDPPDLGGAGVPPVIGTPSGDPTGGPTITPPPQPDTGPLPATRTPGPAPDGRQLVAAPLADLARFYPALAGAALLALTSSRLVQWLAYRLRLTPP